MLVFLLGFFYNNNSDNQINISEFLSLKTLLPPSLPEAGSEFEVTVSYAVSPDNFVILPQTGGAGGNYRAGCLVVMPVFCSLQTPLCTSQVSPS